MYVQISDKLITDTLKNYRELSAQITSRVEEVLKNIVSDEELMSIAAMPGRDFVDNTDHAFNDVADVYDAFIKLKDRQELEARMQIRELTEKLETMNRIMACYYVLPWEMQEVLEFFYIANESVKEGTMRYMEKYSCDIRSAQRRRAKAIRELKAIYEEDWSKEELFNSKKYR